jgi:MinD-like ATPase involved in chromosome partitioning or flagellar assembly
MLRQVLENEKKEASFHLFFLENNPDQSVKVVEVDEIDFEEVKKHLEKGESVFISPKREQKQDAKFIAYKPVKKPWYLLRS